VLHNGVFEMPYMLMIPSNELIKWLRMLTE